MKILVPVSIVAVWTAGCYGPGGPAERTGRSIDHGAAKVGGAVEKTGQKIQETAQ